MKAAYPKLNRWFSLIGDEQSVQASEKQWPSKETVLTYVNVAG